MKIDYETYINWKDQIILHDEDEWNGKYKTVGEMWKGEGYEIEEAPKPKVTNFEELSMDIEIEISEVDVDIRELEKWVQKKFPNARFSRTEPRYESCIMAIFELA